MKKRIHFIIVLLCFISASVHASKTVFEIGSNYNGTDSLTNVVVEPWTYSENFEDRTLGAWASYPLWQDTAYDPNFRVDEMIPGDSNISVVQKVTPYTNVDNYAGAQKLLNMYLAPGSTIKFRYYLKSNDSAEFFKIRFAGGKYGKIDYALPVVKRNEWVWVTVSFDEIISQNPELRGNDKVKIYALAFLTKIPDADPAMPFYLGLDDIVFEGKRASAFRFTEPAMVKLPEFDPYIPKEHFNRGDSFNLSGTWNLDATKVGLRIFPLADSTETIYEGNLLKRGDQWNLSQLKLQFPEGLYIGRLVAFKGPDTLSKTEFTIHIAPETKAMAGKHPRLLYDEEERKTISQKLKGDRFREVSENIAENAKREREEIPVESLIFDLDQFPEEDWLPTWSAWGSRIYNTAGALRANAMAYAFHGDQEAGNYAKNVLLRLSEWPNWTHPWQTKRGRFSEHRTGSWSHRVAEAYDLTYDLMTPEESRKIREAIMKNIVEGAHRTYVHNDNITSATSNWLAMIVGGSLMNMAAIYADGPDTENLEPYFTGAMLKYYRFLNRVTAAGAWGEGLGYNSYSFSNMSYSIPSIENVFNVDMTHTLVGTYNQYIWGGIIKDRQWFDFGDSGGNINPVTNWAFLLDKQKEPRLGWYYNYLKNGEAESNTSGSNNDVDKKIIGVSEKNVKFEDVLYNTVDVPQDSPFDENPVKIFPEVGTTVFKSGWEKDDFVFVMRTGPFYNHQHLDQGSLWIAYKGDIFLEDGNLKNSNYYEDPLYQPWLTQPVGHSTILIDGNHQSQRVGDPINFAPGFEDYAFIRNYLVGEEAAFSSGDIGRLYWEKVKSLTRNVLYLKPRTLLMLDIAVPQENGDVDVTLLYQTKLLESIEAGVNSSTITKDNATLHIKHLSPDMEALAVKTPHYLKTLRTERNLKQPGMLTVTARTEGKPLVMANLLTTTTAGETPKVTFEEGNGFVSGVASGKNFAYTTKPGNIYEIEDIQTDALALTWEGGKVFVAMATVYRKNNDLFLESETPVTFEFSEGGVKFYSSKKGKVKFRTSKKPSSVMLNGKTAKFQYDENENLVVMDIPAGGGEVVVQLE